MPIKSSLKIPTIWILESEWSMELVRGAKYSYRGKSLYRSKTDTYEYLRSINTNIGVFYNATKHETEVLLIETMAPHQPETNKDSVSYLYREGDT